MKGSLIISGGAHKGTRIACPPGEIRPAVSVMREVLFQVLANMLARTGGVQAHAESTNAHTAFEGCSIVDMFSGSALMALEFISRGAAHAVAVESDARKWPTLLKNINLLCGTGQARPKRVFLYKDKAERFIVKHKKTHDIVYCDPPFAYAHKGDLLRKIAQSALLKPTSIVVIHTPTPEKLHDSYGELRKADTRAVGSSSLHFYTVC